MTAEQITTKLLEAVTVLSACMVELAHCDENMERLAMMQKAMKEANEKLDEIKAGA